MLFLDVNFTQSVKEKWILVDNNFLSIIFRNKKLLSEFNIIFSESTLTIDSFVKFEFLRDVYIVEERINREEFLKMGLVEPLAEHSEI